MKDNKPYWMPDTQGFLAIAIIIVMATVILILLTKDYTNINDKVFGALLTLLGVLAGCFKDVYGFFFGSSSGSKNKDDAIAKIATTPIAPIAPIAPVAPVAPIAPIVEPSK